jgi:hypothetical protein
MFLGWHAIYFLPILYMRYLEGLSKDFFLPQEHAVPNTLIHGWLLFRLVTSL